MGKRGGKKLTSTQGGAQNLKSVLRHEHLKNLALWSSAGDTPIPSLASLFGRRLAADEEASGIATEPDIVFCQRCETILKPDVNCNVRIEKVSSANKKKRTKCKKSNICLPQNNVVYHFNFCSHRNLKRGTLKGQMKEIYPFKPKTSFSIRPKITKEVMMPEEVQSNMLSSPERSEKDQVGDSVMNTPKPMLTLDRDKRIRKSKSKKPVEPESVSEKTAGGSNKRKRKSWTDMKELTETNKTSKVSKRVSKAMAGHKIAQATLKGPNVVKELAIGVPLGLAAGSGGLWKMHHWNEQRKTRAFYDTLEKDEIGVAVAED